MRSSSHLWHILPVPGSVGTAPVGFAGERGRLRSGAGGTGEAGPQLEIPLCASQVMVFDAKGFATE